MKKPNILFLFADQHRGDWMPYNKETFKQLGIEELPLRMPNIKKLMEEGATFTRTVSSSPLCAPARACLASGLRYDRCQVPDNSYNYPLDQKTFYSVLKENGYKVGGVGKFDLNKPEPVWEGDWPEKLKKIGFTDVLDSCGKWDGVRSVQKDKPKDPYMRYLNKQNLLSLYIEDMEERRDLLVDKPTKLPQEAYGDTWVADQGMEMLQSFSTDEPWFLMVNYPGPHDPWDVTEEMKERWKDVDFPLPVGWDKDDPEKINGVRQNYAAMLENIDKTLGNFIEEIEKRGELDNTYIIYSADHGEMLGDFNKFRKRLPKRGSVRVPLVMWGPKIKPGICSQALVELQDLTATITDIADLSMEEAVDSKSLVPILQGEKNKHRKYQISALNDWRLICDEKYKLVVRENEKKEKEVELYDLEKDPLERENIAGSNKKIVDELKEKLDENMNT
ncbi:MAG: sulfatase [bacterium]